MSRRIAAVGVAIVLAVPWPTYASGWQLQPAAGDRHAILTFDAGEPVSYKFECGPTDVIVTQTGVTKMIDLKTGKPIGDDAAAVMPPGAAMMALFGGNGDPEFMPAEATKNPTLGWDLTIHLLKEDKKLSAISKSKIISLFTTGYTTAVPMTAASRAKWNDFIQHC